MNFRDLTRKLIFLYYFFNQVFININITQLSKVRQGPIGYIIFARPQDIILFHINV